MGFIAISIDQYIKKHLESNPLENEDDLRELLNSALSSYEQGIKCSCGNDIWVIGSAYSGNRCFTCITGEDKPDDDYELDSVLNLKMKNKQRKQIDRADITEINGIFDDNGNEINTTFIKKPSLCLTCQLDENPNEEMLCVMTRYDQKDDNKFNCFAFKKKLNY